MGPEESHHGQDNEARNSLRMPRAWGQVSLAQETLSEHLFCLAAPYSEPGKKKSPLWSPALKGLAWRQGLEKRGAPGGAVSNVHTEKVPREVSDKEQVWIISPLIRPKSSSTSLQDLCFVICIWLLFGSATLGSSHLPVMLPLCCWPVLVPSWTSVCLLMASFFTTWETIQPLQYPSLHPHSRLPSLAVLPSRSLPFLSCPQRALDP